MNKIRVRTEKEYWDSEAQRPDFERYVYDPEVNTLQCVKNIDKAIGDAKNILEIGCGIGRLTFPISLRNKQSMVHGVDISKNMLKIAKERKKEFKIKNCKFYQNDGRLLPEEIQNIDAAYSMITFQHISPDGVGRYIQQVGERMVKGGRFYFQYVEGLEREPFSQQYRKDTIENWLRDYGFSSSMDLEGYFYSPNWTWILAIKK